MCRLAARLLILASSFGLVLPAQYPPGGYPPGQYPPGQYPPGQGPMGGGGISLPGRHKKNQKQSEAQQPSLSAEGKTVSNDGKKLVVETKDGRTLTMSVTPQTKYTRSGNTIEAGKIVPRTTVHIDAAEDDEANLTAIAIDLVKDAPPEAPAEAGTAGRSASPGNKTAQSDDDEEMARSTILHNPVDVPDRPVLHRGEPKKTSSSDDDDDLDSGPPVLTRQGSPKQALAKSKEAEEKKDSTDFTIGGETAQVRRPPSNDLIDRAKEWAQTFTDGLPNFVCEQVTTRYMQQSKLSGWQPLDLISAKVVFEDGKENYREIMVGGKRTNKSMLELGGSTSTGEFASTLRSLFSQGERAEFKLLQTTTIAGTSATVYDFKVPLEHSGWFINVGGQSLRPAYSGSVWIDRATAHVRRIEMQADNIPKDFPLDAIEWAVDYDNVRLGTNSFLLPSHAENLGCQRGSPICTKNAIDFRNYHKYSGESTIEFK
jgi:hypothetical protein